MYLSQVSERSRIVNRPTTQEDIMAEPKNTNKTTATQLQAQDKDNPPIQEPSHCLLCGQLGPVLSYGHWICEHCKNLVQAELLSKKRKIEKGGG
jgi:hypothetical protein